MRTASQIFATQRPMPKGKRRTHITRCGKHQTRDDYAWLRAKNWRDVMHNPDTLPDDIRAHLRAENAYCDDAMNDAEDLQHTLIAEMRGRIREEDCDVPVEDGAYAYFDTYKKASEYPVHARRALNKDGSLATDIEEVLDCNHLARNSEYFDLGSIAHSPNHRFLAYSTDRQGSEYYEIRIKDLSSGMDLPSIITSASAQMVWSADSASIFWIWRDDSNRPREVRQHKIYNSSALDTLVYREQDDGFFLSLGQTSDRRFILIAANDHSTSEVRILDTNTPDVVPMLIAPRQQGFEYHIDHAGQHFYILTNADGAEDFKIVIAPQETPQRAYWQDLIEPQHGVRRLEQRLFLDHHVRLERRNALPRLVVRNLHDGTEHEISFTGEVHALGLEHLLDFNTARMRFTFSSPTQPDQVYDYDMRTRTRHLRKTQEIPSGHNPDDYCVSRIYADAPDGEAVPVSLVYRKGLKRNGSAPLLLYGYGAYGITIETGFCSRRISLLDRGFVYAIAHVRGGEAKGHAWYTAAKGLGKTNTFHDFIAVAQSLIAKGYTAERRIIAMGGSAGGLLVGAVMNMAPELFGGVIAAVPFVDVLSTMCDETLPLTPPEWPEWGNPRTDERAFANIAAYSPYDNIAALPYPPLLATAGLTDPRVTYWEPAKWVARLRHTAPQAGPYFLKTEMNAGHGGTQGRFEGLKTVALEYAFAIKAVTTTKQSIAS